MEMNFDFMNETRRGDGTGKGSRPGSGTPGLSFRSTAIKLYSGVKFYDVKKTSSRPSSRASVTSKSSHMSKMGLNTVRLGSIASKLKQPKPTKIHVQQPNPTKYAEQPKPTKVHVEQRFIDFRTEVNFLFTCDLCSEDDKNVPANGYCSECKQYMCVECLTFHRRVNATKSHTILAGEDLQKTTKDTRKAKTNCLTHPSESLKYFCHTHNTCICEKCKFIEHGKCDNVTSVSDQASGIHKSQETKRILYDLDAILTEFQHLKQSRESDLREIKTKRDEIINSLKATRTQIIELLDTIEAELLQAFKDSMVAEIEKVENQTATFDTIIPILQGHKDDIVNLKEIETVEELFVAVKKAAGDIKRYSEALKQIHKDSYKLNISFEPNEKLTDFYETLESLGHVRIRKVKSGCGLPSLSIRPHSEREALFAGEVNIYFQTDTIVPSIYKLQELTDGWLVMSDTANEKLKLYDNEHRAVCEMILSSPPKGMTFMPPSEVVVALNKERCIQRVFLDKESGLTMGRKYSTKLNYIDLVDYDKHMVGIAENRTRFFVNLVSTKGYELKCVRRESKSSGMFTNLMYIKRNRDGSKIYVTDSVSGCYAISVNGEILSHISDTTMDDYRGICVSPQGGLYIAGCHSNNIVLFSEKGEKVKDVIDKNLSQPSSVCYNTIRNQLVISYAHAQTVKVFTLL